MKTEIVATVIGGIVAVVTLGFCFLQESNKQTKISFVKNTTDENLHDWECKFCIEDGYNGDGKVMYHYINEYTRNVNHSITFVGHDGLLWTIPYPYFYIHVNPNYKK